MQIIPSIPGKEIKFEVLIYKAIKIQIRVLYQKGVGKTNPVSYGFTKSNSVQVTLEGQNKDGCSGQYDQICNALLPQGLNPLSVPPKELAASLGYHILVSELSFCGTKII